MPAQGQEVQSQRFDQIMLNGNPNHTFFDVDISYGVYGIYDRQLDHSQHRRR